MSNKPKLKLYVWTEWAPDYSDGLAFAVAADEPEARRLVVAAYGDTSDWGTLHEFDLESLETPFAFAVGGGG